MIRHGGTQHPDAVRVGNWVGGLDMSLIDIHEVGLEHAVYGDEPLKGRVEVPDALTQPHELV
jgi:hypothetical protein